MSSSDFSRRLLAIQYGARLPPRSPRFRWPGNAALLAIQSHLANDLFADSHPPSTKYLRAFLKELTARLQDAVDEAAVSLAGQGVEDTELPEVDSDLLEQYAELMTDMPASMDAVPEPEYVTYLWPRSAVDPNTPMNQVVLREEGSAISRGTTGLKTWEASLRLASHLLANQADLLTKPGSRVLELGSGAGLLGAVCATQQATSGGNDCRTWMTDVSGQVLERIEETLHLNGLGGPKVQVHPLDWVELAAGERAPIDWLAQVRPTLVIAADVVYDPDLAPALATTIRTALEACEPGVNPIALVASTIRNDATYSAFLAALETQGLRAKPISLQSPETGAPLPYFPSAHDPVTGGVVELLKIVCQEPSQ